MSTTNHYATLGVKASATLDEIRRAYRVLARRYHPDVNPQRDTSERFKAIAAAYTVLSDPEARRAYDNQLQNEQRARFDNEINAYRRAQGSSTAHRAFERAQSAGVPNAARGKAAAKPPSGDSVDELLGGAVRKARKWWSSIGATAYDPQTPPGTRPNRLSVIEVSLSVYEAIQGARKTVEIAEPEGTRKVSVRIPPGVRPGSVVRLRGKGPTPEDLLVIIRIAYHPLLSIESKGLIVEVPITVAEAISGASISIPTLEDQVLLKIPAGSQSGLELRLAGKGMPHSDGTRGDLFVRLMIKVPDAASAIGIQDAAKNLEAYYSDNLRSVLPRSLLETATR